MNEDEEFEFRLRAEREAKPAEPKPTTYLDRLGQQTRAIAGEAKDTLGGLVRGAGSIGNTILSINSLGQLGSREERARGMDAGLRSLGANPDSASFQAGKLGGEIAGTAGVGGALAQGAGRMGAVPELVNALRTGGFTTGATSRGALDALAVRGIGGGVTGTATVGAVSPDDALKGGTIGMALPGVLKAAGAAGGALADAGQAGARKLMGSALKGTAKMHTQGDVDTAVQTLLDYGINPTPGGVERIKGLVGELNTKIAAAIEGSGAKIDKQKVLNALAGSREKFGNQVSPTNDLAAIDSVGADFMQSHPDELPVQLAQKLKQGTYKVLKGKYGEVGSASTEAQKDLARGLKEGVAEAVPEVAPLNAAESRLLTTLKVAERRAMMDVNKNPIALDAGLALATGHPGAALGLLANSWSGAKSMGARALNTVSSGSTSRVNALAGPAVYRSLPRAGDTSRK